MPKLIMEALAFDSGKASGVNVETANNSSNCYIESALVSLASAKRENPECDAVLYCNEPVGSKHAEVAERFGIRVKSVPFDDYVFEPGLPWRLAYYKLCALANAVGCGRYDSVCLMDSDTWSSAPISELLTSRGGVFMVELESRLSDADRISMERTYDELGLDWDQTLFPTCWGGEFVCGDTGSLGLLLDGCKDTYARMRKQGVSSKRGDEFLLYASANRAGFPAFSANAYVRRVWTGRYFTPCRHESYAVLHFPAEKNYAFPKAWRTLERGELVDTGTFVGWCGLRPSNRSLNLAWAMVRAAQKARS